MELLAGKDLVASEAMNWHGVTPIDMLPAKMSVTPISKMLMSG